MLSVSMAALLQFIFTKVEIHPTLLSSLSVEDFVRG